MLIVLILSHQLTPRFVFWKQHFLKCMNAVESHFKFYGFAMVSSLKMVSVDSYLGEDSLWLRVTRISWKNICTLVEFCSSCGMTTVSPCELCFPRKLALGIQVLGAYWQGQMLKMYEYSSSAINLSSSLAQIHLKIWFKWGHIWYSVNPYAGFLKPW